MADLYHAAAGIIKAGFEKKGNLKNKKIIDKVLRKSHDSIQEGKEVVHQKCQLIRKLFSDFPFHQVHYFHTTLSLMTLPCLVVLSHFDATLALRLIDGYLRLVVVYDILFGKGVHCGGDLKQFCHQNEAVLQETLKKLQKKNKTGNSLVDDDQLTVTLPRYVRVNKLKTTLENVVKTFQDDDFTFIENQTSEIPPGSFCRDNHLPDLLVFSPGTDLHKHPLYLQGHVVLQDKASCLPAYLLDPDQEATVIDACAAPGNKTSHLASLMGNRGKIFAFDLDKQRLKLMDTMLKKAGVTSVETKRQDFLKVNPTSEKYSEAECILLDPSCSGSGMVTRMANLLEDTGSADESEKHNRLKNLASFQIAALSHALNFPKVKRVTYSTCSVHEEENEDVVKRILGKFKGRFKLMYAMPAWKHRGLSTFKEGPKCLRASPKEDKTNGFFVAVFERIESMDKCSSENVAGKNRNVTEDNNTKTLPSTKELGSSKSERRKSEKRRSKNIIDASEMTASLVAKQSNKSKKRRSRNIMRKPVTMS